MPDREKVINAIEKCLNFDDACNECDYDGCVFKHGSCEKDLLADALELLKEQDYRGWLMDMFHKYGRDDLIALLVLHREEKLLADALKEQGAKPPGIMQDIEGIWSTCSICGHKLRHILAMEMDTYFPKFCSECGQAVKWE